MGVRVAIITPASPAHHGYFCSFLAERHDVVGVIHPASAQRSFRRKLRRIGRYARSDGYTLAVLRLLATVPGPLRGWDDREALARAEERFFASAAVEYESARIPAIAQHVEDVHSDASVDYLRSLEPDVVVCLGGPIYREPLIGACGTMVNFHSGISPIYNGASTVLFAFANGHIGLCGGTLMTLSPIVDGGNILAHYLPAIESGDDPAALFMKTVTGAARVTSDFLDHLSRSSTFTSASQTAPLFYTRGADWTIREGHRVRRLLERDAAARHARHELVIPYWDCGTDEDAALASRRTVERLLGLV